MAEGDTHQLIFAVNGDRFDLQSVDPSTTLLEFLRTKTRFKSVKLGCGEGGCGACVVVLSKYDHRTDRVENYTVSSCLTLLCSINGCSITTSEGLGNSRDGFHTIHQRFAGFHATQCGFCTPGICMSLFSAISEADNRTSPSDQSPGFSNLSALEAEKSVSGNLCRCTGYRPIADVCKSFTRDMDIEDLGLNSFWKKGDSKEIIESKLPFYNSEDNKCMFPDFLKTELKSLYVIKSNGSLWCTPRSIEELQDLLESNKFDKMSTVKLVVGNTGVGYYTELEKYDKYIDLRYIQELSRIEIDHTGVCLGATTSISKAIAVLREGNNSLFNNETASLYKRIADHFEKVASNFIRNSGSIGGNLVMAQRNNFPSDLVTVLLAAGAMVDLVRDSKRETISLREFVEGPTLESKSFLVSVRIPSWIPVNVGTKSALIFETYRASPRPFGNALPYLNAAFWAEVSLNSNCNAIVINNIRLVLGAFGCKHAIRARNVEDFLIGKLLDNNLVYEAAKLIPGSVVPEDGISHGFYRTSLASAFLFQFLHPFVEACKETCTINLNGRIDILSGIISKVSEKYEQFKMNLQDPLLLSAKQAVGPVGEFPPVGEPVIKSAAALQASGEALYVDDIPSPTNCLYGAFIYSTKPLARIKEVKFKTELLPEGVDTIISFKDIPKGGENIGSKTIFSGEPLFAEDLTICAGQPIALVVADTQKQADSAANLALVEYDLENIDPPILTVEEAEERSSFFEVYPFIRPKPVGDFSKGMDEADHKIVSAEIRLPSQYYFYMETQSALAIPEEDNCMVVHSSSQCPEMAHTVIAKCLGIPENNVRVITRRVGGGFGGKAIRAMPTATACALAAHTLRRPVKIYLNRKTDMVMAGGRHPMKVTYTVGFKSNGKVTALHVKILINAGKSEDISPIMPLNIVNSLKKYSWGALSLDIKVCKTNHSSKSAMRGPGEVQGSFIAEAVIEHIASSLSIDADSVREKNLHSFKTLSFFYEDTGGEPHEYTLPLIWDKVALFSIFDQRVEMIREFNESNLWRKRGMSRVPVIHGVMLRPTPGKVSVLGDGSIVVEVGGIEIGQGLWTKVKQMAAFALCSVKCEGTENLLDKVRVIQADTLSIVQGGFTSGSTTSEASCEAVRICCGVLVERLNLLNEKLKKQMGSVDWEMLIAQAHMQSVNLSASTYYVPELTSMHYLNYGAAVSEVEVNLLTGETTILRSDIVYDCGKSLNPAVDLGQIEGAFVQGIGFFMTEEYLSNPDGLVIADSTWSYKIPTIDTVPKQLNVEVLNSGHHQKRVLSSKASGEPPLLLAASVHCATRAAIKEARKQISGWKGVNDGDNNNGHNDDSIFQLSVPATMPVVKELCGLDVVERYLSYKLSAAVGGKRLL